MSAEQVLRDKFYSQDGTWRTAEPSWRYVLSQKQNVRGSTNYMFPLHDPGDVSALGMSLGVRHNRGLSHAESIPATPKYAPLETSAMHAAFSLCHPINKDQKRSGFMNETLMHTELTNGDAARWGRLGIMTRERLGSSDKFGDIAIPGHQPRTNELPFRPAPAEKTGFTRGAATHGAHQLTGGFFYTPEAESPKIEHDLYSVPQRITGYKMASGFTLNNPQEAPSSPVDADSHYMKTSIGHPGASAKVDKYGDLKYRPPTVLELAALETGPVETLKVEDSGFTRTRWNGKTGAVPDLVRIDERSLAPTQIQLRKMANPIEFYDPHAHKGR